MIRPATIEDHDAIWEILEPILRAGETYALPREITRDAALAFWLADGHEVFVTDGGTYFLREHAPRSRAAGEAASAAAREMMIANCGYASARRGVGRQMLEHSLDRARARGFTAMQFNFVVASNRRAVELWERSGFAVVERRPGAFAHPTLGFVDALVMSRAL